MADVIEEARKIWERRKGTSEPRLDENDVKHLIYTVMKDASIDHQELYDLLRLNSYKDDHMTSRARDIFSRFVGVINGDIEPKRHDQDLYSIAKEMLKGKRMGPDSKLDLDDIKELIFRVIEDGRMSRYELDEMKKVERYSYFNMTPDAEAAFKEFMEGFKVKVESFEREQMQKYRMRHQAEDNETYDQHIVRNIRGRHITRDTKVHDLAPSTYRQCGSCYGTGRTTCSSCGGMGGHYSSRVDYDYDGTPTYRDEFIPCSCSGGYDICGTCGGSGSVYA